jgi:hypothetical protein
MLHVTIIAPLSDQGGHGFAEWFRISDKTRADSFPDGPKINDQAMARMERDVRESALYLSPPKVVKKW